MVAVDLAEKPFGSSSSSSFKFLEQLQSKGYYGFHRNEQWIPSVNLYETETAYLVCVDLAGVEKSKIDLEVIDSRLVIRGRRPVPSVPQADPAQATARIRVHLMEIDHGIFARDVELPMDIRKDEIHAKYHDGMLWIELPKNG